MRIGAFVGRYVYTYLIHVEGQEYGYPGQLKPDEGRSEKELALVREDGT